MRFKILAFLLLLPLHITFAQLADEWVAYFEEETRLVGFKNKEGKVMISPKFMGITIARKFNHIITVMEANQNKYVGYYLTKSGRKVGIDSLHIQDNSGDCENEGFIRFQDKNTTFVGLFDKNGNIAIPAKYNALSRVHNGLVWALKDAKKSYWNYHKDNICNHFSWKGGQEILLNKEHKVIVKEFKYNGRLDYYSLQIQNQPSTNPAKVNFKGTNGKYYVFSDMKKEFTQWLNQVLIPELTKSKLALFTMDSITYRKNIDWVTESKQDFLAKHFKSINSLLIATQNNEVDYFISIDGLSPYRYNHPTFDLYFNDCGESKEEQYPILDLVINTKNEAIQYHIEFLKTDEGYRLISVDLN